jgi:hypothetical protein
VKDYDSQLTKVTQSLAEFKHRAHTAEVLATSALPDCMPKSSQLKLEESSSDSSRTGQLEKSLKEKDLLIGKLRHEGAQLCARTLGFHHPELAHSRDHQRALERGAPQDAPICHRPRHVSRSKARDEHPAFLPHCTTRGRQAL